MKTVAGRPAKISISLALSWDGAVLSSRNLPLAVRKSLGRTLRFNSDALAGGLEYVAEIRLCWVPVLTGRKVTLCDPFTAPDGKRLLFRAVRTRQMGDCLEVVYRPLKASATPAKPRPASGKIGVDRTARRRN